MKMVTFSYSTLGSVFKRMFNVSVLNFFPTFFASTIFGTCTLVTPLSVGLSQVNAIRLPRVEDCLAGNQINAQTHDRCSECALNR